jgi:hypothetical protein
MAFPTTPTTGASRLLTTNQLDSSSTRTFPSLTSLTKNSGDLLIAIVYAYQTTTAGGSIWGSWGGSLTEFVDIGGSTNGTFGAAYKWSTGSETGTFTAAQAGTITGDASMILMSIPGAHATSPPEATAIASGTAAAADPASLSPSWGADDTLWIAVHGNGMTNISGAWTGITAAPTNYTDFVETGAADTSTIGDCEAAVAFRPLNASSEDVGGFTTDLSNARNHAFVIAVRPAAPIPISLTDTASGADALSVYVEPDSYQYGSYMGNGPMF